MKKRVWTLPEIELLKEFYGMIPAGVIAMMLNRSVNAIYTKAYKLKLTSLHNKGRKAKYIKIMNNNKN